MFRICSEFSAIFRIFRICSESVQNFQQCSESVQNLFRIFRIFRICSAFSVMFRIFSEFLVIFRIFRHFSESLDFVVIGRWKSSPWVGPGSHHSIPLCCNIQIPATRQERWLDFFVNPFIVF